jgi:CHAD domain-containing protein
MPAHETLNEYYLYQHSAIEHYLELCLANAETELVHQLRLSIKKLRAFNVLAGQLCGKNIDKQIHVNTRVKELFKIAGQLRDTQVQMQLLANYEDKTGKSYPELSDWLLNREIKYIISFSRSPERVVSKAKAYSLQDKITKMISSASDETILENAGVALKKLFETSQKLSAGRINDTNLHHIRIGNKQIKYILNIMNRCYPDFTFELISVDSLREIEAAAGQWHDNLVRVETLNAFMKKKKGNDDFSLLKYQKLLNAYNTELIIAYEATYQVVKKAFSKEEQAHEL